jgi:integrase
MIAENPCFFLEKKPEDKYVRHIPTEEEMSRILLAAGDDRPFFLVLYHTMARLDEALRLRWEEINFEDKSIKLWTRKRKDGAWDFDILPMNQVLNDTLWTLFQNRKQNEWVFFNEKTGTRYNRRPK